MTTTGLLVSFFLAILVFNSFNYILVLILVVTIISMNIAPKTIKNLSRIFRIRLKDHESNSISF